MSRTVNILSSRNIFFASLFLSALLLLFLAPKAAVNVDEQLHYPHAKKVVNWYFTGGDDTRCLETGASNLKYYGQSVDNFTALVNRVFRIDDEFLTRHFTGAFFFWLLLLFAGLVAYRVSGSFRASSITVLSLLLMPRLFGQAFGNLKDIPFATGYMAAIFFILKFAEEFPLPKKSTAVWLGLAIAFTNSVRIGGLVLFGYLAVVVGAIFILNTALLKNIFADKLLLFKLSGRLLTVAIIGYFAGLIFWPYALLDVFKNPLESLSLMEHYKISIRQIFEGNLIWSTQLPWYYLPKWLLISTPLFVFAGLSFYVFSFINRLVKQEVSGVLPEMFVVFTFLFPVVYVIAIHSNLYSGIRQMLFVIPVLAVVSSIGIWRFMNLQLPQKVRIAGVGTFMLFMIFPLKHQAKTFPVDYVFFNILSGGNNSAWSNYEYDYYFHSIKKSSEYLKKIIGDEQVIVASNCNLSNYFENETNIKYNYIRYIERSSADWDYAVFGVNYIHPYQLKNKTWQSAEIIKTFYHYDNPVAVILKRAGKADFNGLTALKEGDLERGERLIRKALKTDTKNVWLLVHLAKNCFTTNNFSDFDSIMERGFEIHKYYEPLYLLKAQKLYSDKKYNESYEVLKELVGINPRYNNAAPLLKAVKEKL